MRLATRLLAVGLAAAAPAAALAAPAAAAAPATHPTHRAHPPHVAGDVLLTRHRRPVRLPTGLAARLAGSLPDSVDLRANAPAVGNQGQIGDCVEWAIGYQIMGYWAATSGGTGAPFSPLYLYQKVVGKGAPNAGTYPTQALAEATARGVDTDDDYWQGAYDWKDKPTSAETARAAGYRISSSSVLWQGANQGPAARTAVETALAAGQPVAIAFPVYTNLDSLAAGQVYGTIGGSYRGGHMVAALGYNADGVIIRNSWGSSWASGGDAVLSWDFVDRYVSEAYSVAGISTPATAVDPTPRVLSVSAKSGWASGGTSVTITGSGLATATGVSFGGTAATFSTGRSSTGATVLVATAPAHTAGTVDVTVTNGSGTSAASSADRFSYLTDPPSVTGLSAGGGSTAGGGTLTVTGTNLVKVSSVKFGTTKASFRSVSPTSLTVTVPAHAPGAVDLVVSTATGTSPTGSADSFTYAAPAAPAVTGLDSTSGLTYGGTALTVSGTGLDQAVWVKVGGTAVKFTKVGSTGLRLVTPAHVAGTVDVQVGAAWTTSSLVAADRFSYLAPSAPVVTGLSVTSAPATAKTAVRVYGSSFDKATWALVDGVRTTVKAQSDGSLLLTVPAHPAGVVQIQVVTPAGTSGQGDASAFTYTG